MVRQDLPNEVTLRGSLNNEEELALQLLTEGTVSSEAVAGTTRSRNKKASVVRHRKPGGTRTWESACRFPKASGDGSQFGFHCDCNVKPTGGGEVEAGRLSDHGYNFF